MYRTTFLRTVALVSLTLGSGAMLASPAGAQSDAPAGNNGHIKIDDVLMDDGNENVPHPGCTFVVDFFGYDVGTRNAVMTFDGQEPTGGGELYAEQTTFEVESRESGSELNESAMIDLSEELVGIAPHPKQGWHVKLTVNVDGAQGADVKHKVFWVSECESPALIAAQEAVDIEAAALEVATAENAEIVRVASENAAAWLAAEQANWRAAEASWIAAGRPGAAVLSGTATAGRSPSAVTPGAGSAELPRTGTATDALALLGAALIVGGMLFVGMGTRFAAARA